MKIELSEGEVQQAIEQVDLLIFKGKLSQGERAQARRVRKMLINKLAKVEAEDGDISEEDVDDVDSDAG